MLDFADRVGAAVVTGGSGGLGTAIAAHARGAWQRRRPHVPPQRARRRRGGGAGHRGRAPGVRGPARPRRRRRRRRLPRRRRRAVRRRPHPRARRRARTCPQRHLSTVAPEEFRAQLEAETAAFFNVVQPALPRPARHRRQHRRRHHRRHRPLPRARRAVGGAEGVDRDAGARRGGGGGAVRGARQLRRPRDAHRRHGAAPHGVRRSRRGGARDHPAQRGPPAVRAGVRRGRGGVLPRARTGRTTSPASTWRSTAGTASEPPVRRDAQLGRQRLETERSQPAGEHAGGGRPAGGVPARTGPGTRCSRPPASRGRTTPPCARRSAGCRAATSRRAAPPATAPSTTRASPSRSPARSGRSRSTSCPGSSTPTSGRWSRRACSSGSLALERFLADVYGPERDPRRRRRAPPAGRELVALPPLRRRASTRSAACACTSRASTSCATAAGSFRVLEDNLRTPSGISYVIENRRAMTHVFPELFASHRIRRVADYPQQLARGAARHRAARRRRPVRRRAHARASTTPRTSSTRSSRARWASSWSRAATSSAATSTSTCARRAASSGSTSCTAASTTSTSTRCTSAPTPCSGARGSSTRRVPAT